ncbi:MAG: prolipoprotein diacylglyceryl transferase [Clostridia bacterium]|nr:prolipoprotein diacylglyceryl transferase [Clostridia bacterium]
MSKYLLGAVSVLAVLALLILVPTSPALLVDMPETIFSIPTGGVDVYGDPASLVVTVYGLCIALGTTLAIGLTAYLNRKTIGVTGGMALALVSGVFALICSHLSFCAVRWSYIINDLGGSAAYLWQFWQGGYTMYGAILGALLGVVIFAKARKAAVLPLLDTLVPGIALVVALGRFGEKFTLQGMGSYVANEALAMLPFVTTNEWGEAQVMVFAYEALFAAIALIASLAVLARKSPVGRAAETGLAVISLAQVILDSWRGDELIRFGFVRLNMICAAVVLAVIIGTRIARVVKKQGWKAWPIIRAVLFLASAGIVIAIEFALDKSTINNTLLYAVMALTLVMMGVCTLTDDGRQAA